MGAEAEGQLRAENEDLRGRVAHLEAQIESMKRRARVSAEHAIPAGEAIGDAERGAIASDRAFESLRATVHAYALELGELTRDQDALDFDKPTSLAERVAQLADLVGELERRLDEREEYEREQRERRA